MASLKQSDHLPTLGGNRISMESLTVARGKKDELVLGELWCGHEPQRSQS